MFTHRFVRVAVLVGMFGGITAERVHAQGPSSTVSFQTIAVIDIKVTGDTTPALRDEIDAQIMSVIEQIGVDGVSYGAVRKALAQQSELVGCTTAGCLSQLPALVGARQFVSLAVEASGANYNFELALLSIDGDIKRRMKDSCAVCTTRELIDGIGTAAAEFLRTAQAVSVEIASDPRGARLRIEGQDVGAAPYAGRLLPGTYRVSATLADRMPIEQTIDVEAGGGTLQQFVITLQKEAPPPPPPPAGSVFGVLKWAGVTVSVGAIAAGVIGVVIDGQGTCSMWPEVRCENIYQTRTSGLLSIGTGVLFGVGTVLLFGYDSDVSDGNNAVEAYVVPTEGGAMGAVRMRF